MTTTAVAGNVVYNFVKPAYNVYIDDKLVIDNNNLLFNFQNYTYTKNSELCKKLDIDYKWDNNKREARFYSNGYITPIQPSTTINNTVTTKPTITNIVYITKTGKKYHRSGCSYLKNSCIKIDKAKAISQGYTPCSKCNP
jgi:hypothetical protein